jgi:CDP-diacylglycerol---serine O-phosphatidyltransferase
MRHIPNIFTLLNLFFGCLAIVFALQTNSFIINQQYLDTVIEVNVPEGLVYSGICIFIAAIIDFLDGFVARLFKAESEMGAQLDSLSDVVSFGVAPACIIYQLLRVSVMQQANSIEFAQAWLWPAFILALAGAWRLARFNITKAEQSFMFSGLPIPAAGLCIACLPIALWYNQWNAYEWLLNKWLLYAVVALLSWLMVSKLGLMALKFKSFKLADNKDKLLLILLSMVAIVFLKWLAPLAILPLYIIISILSPKIFK